MLRAIRGFITHIFLISGVLFPLLVLTIPAQAQINCRNLAIIVGVDVSQQTRVGGIDSLDENINSAKNILARLFIDNVVRCPQSEYSVGVYYYSDGADPVEVIRELEPLDIRGANPANPQWNDTLETSLQELVDSLPVLQQPRGTSSSYPQFALERALAPIRQSRAEKRAVILVASGRGSTLSGQRVLSDLVEQYDPHDVYVVAHPNTQGDNVGAAFWRRVSALNFRFREYAIPEGEAINPGEIYRLVDLALDDILSATVDEASCNQPFQLLPYQDRVLLDVRGNVSLSRYDLTHLSSETNIILDGSPVRNVGEVAGDVSVLQSNTSTGQFWFLLQRSAGGDWQINVAPELLETPGFNCQIRIIQIPIDTSPVASLTGDFSIYGAEPYYLEGTDTRLAVQLTYADGNPVGPIQSDAINLSGAIRLNGEELAILNFRYDSNLEVWVSDAPPPAPRIGNYTVTLVARSVRDNQIVFETTPTRYDVGNTRAANINLSLPGINPEEPLPMNCRGDRGGATGCEVPIRVVFEVVSDDSVAERIELDELNPGAVRAVLKQNDEIVMNNQQPVAIDLAPMNPVTLGGNLQLPVRTDLEAEDEVSYTIEVTANPDEIQGPYRLIESVDSSIVRGINNADFQTKLAINVLSPPPPSDAIPQYDIYDGFACPPFITPLRRMPIELQVVNEETAEPIAFERFSDGPVDSFVNAILVAPDDTSVTVPLEAVEARDSYFIVGDMSQRFQAQGKGPGEYKLRLDFTYANIQDDFVFIGANRLRSLEYGIDIGYFENSPGACEIGIPIATGALILLLGVYLIGLVYYSFFTPRAYGNLYLSADDGAADEIFSLKKLNRRIRRTREIAFPTPRFRGRSLTHLKIKSLKPQQGQPRIQIAAFHRRKMKNTVELSPGEETYLMPDVRVAYHEDEEAAKRSPAEPAPRPTSFDATPPSRPDPSEERPANRDEDSGPVLPDDFF